MAYQETQEKIKHFNILMSRGEIEKFTYREIEDELFENRRFFDYAPEYKEQLIAKIKEKFSSACRGNSIYSEEYKRFVSNLENIHVKFNYGASYYFTFSKMDVFYVYQETVKYKTGERKTPLRGEFEYGGVHESYVKGIKITGGGTEDIYEEKKVWKGDVVSLYSYFSDKPYVMTRGFIPKKWDIFEEFSYEDAPDYLDGCCEKWTEIEYTDYVEKLENHKQQVIEDAKETIKKTKGLKSFEIESVQSGSWIENAEMYVLPQSFEVWVDFKGKKYAQTCKEVEHITAKGEQSDHWQKFEQRQRYYESKDTVCTFLPKILSILFGLIPVVYFLIWWGNHGLFQVEGSENSFDIGGIVIAVVFAALWFFLFGMRFRRFPREEMDFSLEQEEGESDEDYFERLDSTCHVDSYDPKKDINVLLAELDETYESVKKKNYKKMFVALGVSMITLIALIVIL